MLVGVGAFMLALALALARPLLCLMVAACSYSVAFVLGLVVLARSLF